VGGAVVTVCAAVAAFVTVGLAVATGAFAIRLLVAPAGVDDDEEPAAAAIPMMSTSPQNASNAVSTLCLAGQGLRPCRPSVISGPPAETSGKRVDALS
jgi:hypothetical protein